MKPIRGQKYENALRHLRRFRYRANPNVYVPVPVPIKPRVAAFHKLLNRKMGYIPTWEDPVGMRSWRQENLGRVRQMWQRHRQRGPRQTAAYWGQNLDMWRNVAPKAKWRFVNGVISQ